MKNLAMILINAQKQKVLKKSERQDAGFALPSDVDDCFLRAPRRNWRPALQYLVVPLGIDTRSPRFTWTYAGGK